MYRGPHDFYELAYMLKKKRCKILLARYEILAACHLIGKPCVTNEMALELVPGVPEESFHFFISKNYKHGEELLLLINKNIEMLRERGKLEEILNKYTTP